MQSWVEVAGTGALLPAAGGLLRGRRREPVVRLLIEPYRGDRAAGESLAALFQSLHPLAGGRAGLALELHLDRRSAGTPLLWFSVLCPPAAAGWLQAALRAAYPNVRLRRLESALDAPPAAVALRRRLPLSAHDEPVESVPGVERVLAAMAAAGAPASVRLSLRPASRLVEQLCSSAERPAGPLWWGSVVVFARDRDAARAVASSLCSGPARLVVARASSRAWRARARVRRTPLHLFRPAELAGLWNLPAPEFAALPLVRRALPLAPAPPGIERAAEGGGVLRDEHGEVTIELPMRRQHVAVVGAVDQGKTSLLVASARDDLRRDDCALIVLDPKGDAAEAILSAVPSSRRVTLLDMAAPTCGFNPLAVEATPDAIADHVVAALRGLFSEGEVRGSSDRYLRNAVIAALACGGGATLWDAARLLEVGEEGARFRAAVAERLIDLPSYAELARFFAVELPAQLADARATTTAKLDAPANKLARVLNSPAVKRVLLNDSLRIDFDLLIERREVLVVRGALGEVGPGNVAVLMQLLLGMLDASLSRIQDRVAGDARRAVALKVDEAPLVINAAFAQTLALKRSAGLETVACWQTDAQWEPELREQLDALFAHRVLFATASAIDARSASALLMADFSDQIRAGDEQLATLASPDVRLHLPRHTALVSWTTSRGRERPFIATTIPLELDQARIAWHAHAQADRGGRELRDPIAPASVILGRSGGYRGVGREPGLDDERPGAETAAQLRRDRATQSRHPDRATQSRPGAVEPRPAVASAQSPPGGGGARSRAAGSRAAGGGTVRSPRDAVSQSPRDVLAQSPRDVLAQSPRDALAPPPRDALAQSPRDVLASTELPPSFAELAALDSAVVMRVLPTPRSPAAGRLSPVDRALLVWLAGARCALTSQIHRRMRPQSSLTVTQRQLKRLADRGLVARFQLHREDGGGMPMCCAVTGAALELLAISARRAPQLDAANLDRLRADVHLTGWLLALERHAVITEVLGPGRAAIAPRVPEVARLELEPPLRPRGFLVTRSDGTREPAESFAAVRPGAVACAGDGSDTLIVPDRGSVAAPALIEPYDHLLAGWWRSVERYRRAGAPPAVVFVCAGAAAARERARAADDLLTACHAEIGVAPADWARPGRRGIWFVDEADVHRGVLDGWRVPALPPPLRDADAETPSRSPFAQSRPPVAGEDWKPPWI